jgi:hypothetical protein
VGHGDGGGGALAKSSVSGGMAIRMAYQDWLTLGMGWNEPSKTTHGPGLGTETVFEASYLWQLTANTSLLPDVQLTINPAANSLENRIWTAGLRLRITL